jgi:hypothetical protein
VNAVPPKIEAGGFWREHEQELREGLLVHLLSAIRDLNIAVDFYDRPYRDPGGDYALRAACADLEKAVRAREILKQLEAEGARDAAA